MVIFGFAVSMSFGAILNVSIGFFKILIYWRGEGRVGGKEGRLKQKKKGKRGTAYQEL